MPRPSLGSQARKVPASVRISRVEEAWLIEQYGTVGAGLRAALEKMFLREVATVTPEPVTPGDTEPSRHLCRVWVEEQYDYVRGTPVLVSKQCAECGRVVTGP